MAESAGSIMNGNGKANGKPAAGRRGSIKKRRSIFAWTFSVVARYVSARRHGILFSLDVFYQSFPLLSH